MEIINLGKEKGITIIAVKGRMDGMTSSEFDKKVEEWFQRGEDAFILNLGELEYISSAGLRSILAMGKKLRAANGSLMVASLTGLVKDVFEIAGFNSIFPVFPSVEAALTTTEKKT